MPTRTLGAWAVPHDKGSWLAACFLAGRAAKRKPDRADLPKASSMSDAETTAEAEEEARDFIREIIHADLAAGRAESVITRFPPEPTAISTSVTPSRSA